MSFLDKFSVKKLRDDLDYWIYIGIGDDIIELKSQRLEYKHLVERYQHRPDCVPQVLWALEHELSLPWFKRPTFWHLVKLNLKRTLHII